jgi:plastocyanin
MSRTLNTSAGEPPAGINGSIGDRQSHGFGWRRLQLIASVGVLVSLLVPMLIQRSVEPFLFGMAVPFVIGLLLMLLWPRVGVVWLGVVSFAELLFTIPFLPDALTHPESMADFLPLFLFSVSTLVGTVAAVPSLREPTDAAADSRRARFIAIGSGVLVAAALVVSSVALAGVDSVSAEPGDVPLVTQDLEFRPSAINTRSGSVSVHVTNEDGTRHTFTIEELGVDLNLPPNSTQRVSFEVEPGTYDFVCRPHESSMQGTLIVK